MNEIFKGMDNAAEMIDENFKDLQYERGTNDDGTYIKFGDGTLIQYSNHNVLAYADGSALLKSWSFPTPFSNTFYAVVMTGLTHVAGKNGFHFEFSNSNVDRTNLVARGNPNQFSSGDTIQVGAFAVGRWK